MATTTLEIKNSADLLALPNRTVIIGDDTAVYVLIKESFAYGPHLLLVSAGGVISRTPLSEIPANEDYADKFVAVIKQ